MRKVILFLMFFFCTLMVYSQVQYIDVVYLKNGGKISGIIVEQIPGESIKIETKDGGLLIFKMDEIEKMTKEKVTIEPDSPPPTKETPPTPPPQEPATAEPPSQPVTAPQNTTIPQTEVPKGAETKLARGTYGTLTVGSHMSKPNNIEGKQDGNEISVGDFDPYTGVTVQAQAVFDVSEQFAFLIGGTVDKYNIATFTSYYIGGHIYLINDKFSPFIFAKGGYGFSNLDLEFAKDEDIKATGPYLSVGGGAKVYLDQSWGLYAEAGYFYQGVNADWEFERYNKTYDMELSMDLSGFTFGVGIFIYP